jgi:hypothetical protein
MSATTANGAINNVQMQQQQAIVIANIIVPFSELASIRVHDTSAALRKRLIVSLYFADPEAIHDALFLGDHFDWPAVRHFLAEANISTGEWLRLISLLHFINEPTTRPAVNELLMAANGGMRLNTQGRDLSPIESMQLCFARAGTLASWDTVCKALLLCNLSDVDTSVALAQLLVAQLSAEATTGKQKAPAAVAEVVLKYLPSCKHSRDDYTRTFARLLSTDSCHVASHVILRSIRCREELHEKARQSALAVLSSTKKPSLSQILEVCSALWLLPSLLLCGGLSVYLAGKGAWNRGRSAAERQLQALLPPVPVFGRHEPQNQGGVLLPRLAA